METSEKRHPQGFVSIIMPVYNACRTNPRYLIESLESIRNQTYKNFELLIVNDGSTDDSERICQDFISNNPDLNIRYYVKENGGQSSARNFGARMARGIYLYFIDQDDVWIETKLEVMKPYWGLDLDLIYTDADVIDENGSVKLAGIHRNNRCGMPHPKGSVEEILFGDIFIMPGVMAIKKETFLHLNGFDEALSGYEDDDLFLRIFEIGKIKYLPISTLKWRMYESNYSQSRRMIKSRLLYCHKLLSQYTNGGKDFQRVKKISYRFFWEFISQAISQYKHDNETYVENLRGAKEIAPFISSWERNVFKYIFFFDNKRAIRKMTRYYELRKNLTYRFGRMQVAKEKAKISTKRSFWRSLFRLKDLAYNNGPPWLRGLYLRITGIQDLRDRIEQLRSQLMEIHLDRTLVARMFLRGKGVEIGALNGPLNVPDFANVRYIDRMSVEQLAYYYPGLDLVKIDIVGDGERLDFIKESSQDFVIANHFLEHCQNPIAAVSNMLRVLKSNGVLFLAIPDKRETFDVDRPVTPIEHLLKDYQEGPDWSKRGHVEEWVRAVERVEDKAEAEKRIRLILKDDYSIHFHVWTQTELLEFFLTLKRDLHFPFAFELVCRNGLELIFILKKIAS